MRKIICDFCKKNEAIRLYKVKQKRLVHCWGYEMRIPEPKWTRIDMCRECYDKLLKGEKDGIR